MRIHIAVSLIKVISILLCCIFLDFDSITWRIIAGFIAGGILSQILLLVGNTRSKNSYLFSYLLLIKLAVWILVIVISSDFKANPFNISNSFIQLAIAGILFFDSFLEQLLKILSGPKLIRPFIKQPAAIENKFAEGYQLYNEIPVWTVLYPIVRWIF